MADSSVTESAARNERLYELLVASQPDALLTVDAAGQILSWNPAAERLTGYARQDAIGQEWAKLFAPGEVDRALRAATGAASLQRELRLVRNDGQHIQVQATLTSLQDNGGPPQGLAVVLRDGGGESALEAKLGADPFRGLAETATSAIITIDEGSTVVYANPATERIFGYSRSEVEGKSLTLFMPESFRQRHLDGLKRYIDTGERRLPWTGIELVGLTKAGEEIPINVTLAEYEHEGKRFFSAIVNDVSERKQMEAKLQKAIRRLQLERQQMPLAAIEWDRSLKIIDWNPAAERMFGYSAEEAIGQELQMLGPEDGSEFAASLTNLLQKEGGERFTAKNATKDGRHIFCEWYNAAITADHDTVFGGSSLVEDVTERKQVEAQSLRHVEQLHALRTIDLAITASLDLEVTLTVLLDMVMTQLGVDAADILLLHQFTQRLEFAAGRGFRTTGVQRSELRLGECSAGRAALERRTIAVPNLKGSRDFTRAELLAGEEFEVHYSAPLVAKGKVVGVLEVFHRTPIHPEPDWIRFLDTLAGQAAIAVESARLFADLQKSNLELVLAYDTTLEGWAQALDLRDSVTEGHSRRVTEMTLRLAKEMGIEDIDLVHIRRGALLHDIGKIGIPDAILNKPGPLTDEEREVMRKHPEYANQFLQPIEYLRPAIDIPYSHHERWDGGGYPQGLKAEQIPLAARIFAVVDVWDAITTSRPYHEAWTREKARQHISSLSGTHMDPQVVDIFLGMEW